MSIGSSLRRCIARLGLRHPTLAQPHASVAGTVSNVRYGPPGQLQFDRDGQTHSVRAPLDIVVVGMPGAALWIAQHGVERAEAAPRPPVRPASLYFPV